MACMLFVKPVCVCVSQLRSDQFNSSLTEAVGHESYLRGRLSPCCLTPALFPHNKLGLGLHPSLTSTE